MDNQINQVSSACLLKFVQETVVHQKHEQKTFNFWVPSSHVNPNIK